MNDKQLWLWRANHYDGKLGAWQACYGFKPFAMYGGNEYIEYVSIEKLNALQDQLNSTQQLLEAEQARTQRLKNIIHHELLR